MPLVTDQQFVTLDHNGKHNNQPSYYNTQLHVCTCMCRKKILYQNSIASQLQKRVLNFMDENIYWWQIGNEE